MNRYVLVLVSLVVSGCTSVMSYQPSADMDVERARTVVEKLTLTQHRDWRPDYITVTDEYLVWGFGLVTRGRATAVAFDNVAIGSGHSTTRETGQRLYFEDIQELQLLSWRRKFKQWYVASVMTRSQQVHLLRTRHQQDAKDYLDALNVLMTKKAAPKKIEYIE